MNEQSIRLACFNNGEHSERFVVFLNNVFILSYKVIKEEVLISSDLMFTLIHMLNALDNTFISDEFKVDGDYSKTKLHQLLKSKYMY